MSVKGPSIYCKHSDQCWPLFPGSLPRTGWRSHRVQLRYGSTGLCALADLLSATGAFVQLGRLFGDCQRLRYWIYDAQSCSETMSLYP
jgi:hypothetical protein